MVSSRISPDCVAAACSARSARTAGSAVGGVVDDDQRSRLQRDVAAGDLGVGFGDGRGGRREAVGDSRVGLFLGGAAPQEVSVGGGAASCRACRAAVRSS